MRKKFNENNSSIEICDYFYALQKWDLHADFYLRLN